MFDRERGIPLCRLSLNIAYSAYHIILGVVMRSWWFWSVGAYYVILSLARFAVLKTKRDDRFVTKFVGAMLIAMSFPLFATAVISFFSERGHRFHMIAMIAIATYTFTKITLATVNFIKSRKSDSKKLVTLRNLSFADAFVSIFSLQRSMLVSFEGMLESEMLIMNAATGTAVSIIVCILGVNILNRREPLQDVTSFDEKKDTLGEAHPDSFDKRI